MTSAIATLATAAFFAVAIAAPLSAQEAAPPPGADIAQILADRIDRDRANIGIAVALVENGDARFVSHGQFGRDDPRPVDEHTPFEAGSISKVFTSLLLAQAINDGLIDLDAPLVDYLPEGTVLPLWEERPITAFDLATHSSGLPSIPADLAELGPENPYSGYGADQLMAWLAEYRLTRPIGEEFEYSNAGVALLGQAIEHVRDTPYAEVVESEILTPLGMEDTYFALTGTERPDMSTGHDAAGMPVGYWDWDAMAPAGGLVSTSADLAKLIAAASGQVETPLAPAFETMLARTRPAGGQDAIGLGWFITPTGSGEIVWHNGITAGFRSFAGFERSSGNGVVVLSNMVTAEGIEDIGMHLLDPALPLRQQPVPREAVAVDPVILDAYVGDYVLAPGVVMSVTTEDGHLFAQLTGQNRFELYPESETEFFFRVVDAQVQFEVVDGTARSLTLFQAGQQMPALKVE
jgi:D-alanyl-D-alanine-carboxypeptidase/D-alanyl-D-alanine-endopeptidase